MLDSLLRILALTRKELLAVLKDKRSRLSLLIPPVVQALIFGYAATYDLNHVTYAVLDQDHSAASRQLLAAVDGSGVFERVADLQRASDIATYIDARRALLVLQINQNFERQLLSGRGADLQVIADGRNSNTAGTAIGYVGSVVEQFNAAWGGDHGWTPPPVQLVTRAWYNPNLETRWFMIPA
jgi:ABC-2 type transport system permease protein